MDLDLFVYDPTGKMVAYSANYDNPHEYVSFIPSVAGKYRFVVRRFANRDQRSMIRMALDLDW